MGLSEEEIDRRVRESAALVGLTEDQLDKSPFDLSGGQKRRVAIAGVIAMEPKVLILDEPTAGLDPRGREAILAQIRAYHQKRGTTVILVSHSMEEIACNVDRILVLRGSHVYMDGTPASGIPRGPTIWRTWAWTCPRPPRLPWLCAGWAWRSTRRSTPWTSWSRRCSAVRGEAGVC